MLPVVWAEPLECRTLPSGSTALPDLVVRSVILDRHAASWGDPVSVLYLIQNVGSADAGPFDYTAPQVVAIDPGHDAWVVGDEDAVLIQFDSEEGTSRRFGLPEEHAH